MTGRDPKADPARFIWAVRDVVIVLADGRTIGPPPPDPPHPTERPEPS